MPPSTWQGDWYICCPSYEDTIGSGDALRCHQVLLVQAKSEEEAATKALESTDEPWLGCLVVLAEAFKSTDGGTRPDPIVP